MRSEGMLLLVPRRLGHPPTNGQIEVVRLIRENGTLRMPFGFDRLQQSARVFESAAAASNSITGEIAQQPF
jgi:hypothetical protein